MNGNYHAHLLTMNVKNSQDQKLESNQILITFVNLNPGFEVYL